CGALLNQAFGTRVVGTRYDGALLSGWKVSPALWESQLSVQQQLAPNVGLTVGYFDTRYRNIYVTDNLSVTPTDFTSYCVTAAADPGLPGGGGNQVCGLRDVSFAKYGQVSNLVTLAPDRSQTYNGIDVLLRARLTGGYLLSGGLSAGRTVTDNCS